MILYFQMETVVQIDEKESVVKGVLPLPLDQISTSAVNVPIAEEPATETSPIYEPVVNHVHPSPPRKRLPKVQEAKLQF